MAKKLVTRSTVHTIFLYSYDGYAPRQNFYLFLEQKKYIINIQIIIYYRLIFTLQLLICRSRMFTYGRRVQWNTRDVHSLPAKIETHRGKEVSIASAAMCVNFLDELRTQVLSVPFVLFYSYAVDRRFLHCISRLMSNVFMSMKNSSLFGMCAETKRALKYAHFGTP